jgi:Tfp pilus assembly protein PilV
MTVMKEIISSKLKTIFCVTAVSMLSMTASTLGTSQPACAQTDSACIDRLMYVTARANSGPTDRGEWRFYQQYGAANGSAMTNAGCRTVGFLGADGWRCPSEVMTFQVMSAAEAVARCNGYVPPDNTYGNSTNNQAARIILNTNSYIAANYERFHDFNVSGSNRTIRIEVTGLNGFDPTLRLENSAGSVINFNDDYGNGFNSQLVYTLPPGNYRAIVGGYSGVGGNYNIVIQSN